jgi:hypothetical protein
MFGFFVLRFGLEIRGENVLIFKINLSKYLSHKKVYMNINIQENIVILTGGKLYTNKNCYHRQNYCLLKWTFKQFC